MFFFLGMRTLSIYCLNFQIYRIPVLGIMLYIISPGLNLCHDWKYYTFWPPSAGSPMFFSFASGNHRSDLLFHGFVFILFFFLGSAYKWDCQYLSFSDLTSFSIVPLGVHPYWHRWQDFLKRNFCIHSLVHGHLGCFLVLVIINSAAVNMGMQITLWCSVFIFFGYILWSKIE